MAIERKGRRETTERRGRGRGPSRNSKDGSGELFGIDVDSLSPTAQVATGAVTLGSVIAGFLVVNILTGWWLWWLIFPFMGVLFPAFGLFLRGIAGVVDSGPDEKASPANDRERELLEALYSKGELTPAQAAMETSLTVREADDMLKELASGGHLDVRVRGGAIFYSLWGSEGLEEREEPGRL